MDESNMYSLNARATDHDPLRVKTLRPIEWQGRVFLQAPSNLHISSISIMFIPTALYPFHSHLPNLA